MRITRESDYAIRIVYCLMRYNSKKSARKISEESGVTQRFTLKILRKLSMAGILRSHRGKEGGYALSLPPEEITLGLIIETIDGPIRINHCIAQGYECEGMEGECGCEIRKEIYAANERLRNDLYGIRLSRFAKQNQPASENGY